MFFIVHIYKNYKYVKNCFTVCKFSFSATDFLLLQYQPTNGLTYSGVIVVIILKTTLQGLLSVEQSLEFPQDSVNRATTSLVAEKESSLTQNTQTAWHREALRTASQLLMLAESSRAEVPCLRTCLSAN